MKYDNTIQNQEIDIRGIADITAFEMVVEGFEHRFNEWHSAYILPVHKGMPLPITGALIIIKDLCRDMMDYAETMLYGDTLPNLDDEGKPHKYREDLDHELKINSEILYTLAHACDGIMLLLEKTFAANEYTTREYVKAAISIADLVDVQFDGLKLAF